MSFLVYAKLKYHPIDSDAEARWWSPTAPGGKCSSRTRDVARVRY
jgi:hypothetical protein